MRIKELYQQFHDAGFDISGQEIVSSDLTSCEENNKTILGCKKCQPNWEKQPRRTLNAETALRTLCGCGWETATTRRMLDAVVRTWDENKPHLTGPLPESYAELYQLADMISTIGLRGGFSGDYAIWKKQLEEKVEERAKEIAQKTKNCTHQEIITFYHHKALEELSEQIEERTKPLRDKTSQGEKLQEEYKNKLLASARKEMEERIKEQLETPEFFLVDFDGELIVEQILFAGTLEPELFTIPRPPLEQEEYLEPGENGENCPYILKLEKPLTVEEMEIIKGLYQPTEETHYGDLNVCYQALNGLT